MSRATQRQQKTQGCRQNRDIGILCPPYNIRSVTLDTTSCRTRHNLTKLSTYLTCRQDDSCTTVIFTTPHRSRRL